MDLFSQPPQVPGVFELTRQIKQLLESNFSDVLVQGEVSQPKLSSNGHLYFTLKDENAQLACVIWRSSLERLKTVLEHGMRITAGGEIQLYAPSGRYQLIVNYVQHAGIGALQARFEALKARLQSEGLFDTARKRSLPAFPETIGVVSSESGAAFQDIRNTLERRWPLSKIRLYHAAVQGSAAVQEIVNGINYFSGNQAADVLIVGRGGGSLEDLWSFNEEAVARAIYACSIPVISAVGHETDFTISDFVADARAATPTQAAVLATPDQNDVKLYLDETGAQFRRTTFRKIERLLQLVSNLSAGRLKRDLPARLNHVAQQVEYSRRRMFVKQTGLLEKHGARIESLSQQLQNLRPDRPLENGYSRIVQQDDWVKNAAAFSSDLPFSIVWKDGVVVISGKKNQPPAS